MDNVDKLVQAIKLHISSKRPTTTYEVREILLDSKLDPESFGKALNSLEKSGYISIEYGSNNISGLNINENFPNLSSWLSVIFSGLTVDIFQSVAIKSLSCGSQPGTTNDPFSLQIIVLPTPFVG